MNRHSGLICWHVTNPLKADAGLANMIGCLRDGCSPQILIPTAVTQALGFNGFFLFFCGGVRGDILTAKNRLLKKLRFRHYAPSRIKTIHSSKAFVLNAFRACLLTNISAFFYKALRLSMPLPCNLTFICTKTSHYLRLNALNLLLCTFQLSYAFITPSKASVARISIRAEFIASP